MKDIKIYFILNIIGRQTHNTGSCTWPNEFASTTWYDSSKGEVQFTTDELSGWTIKITGITGSPEYDTWRCHSTALYESDNILVIKTQNTFAPFGTQFYGYICLQLTEITTSSYRYYLRYNAEPNIDNERVVMSGDSNRDDWGLLCLLDDTFATYMPPDSEYRVMIKTGDVASAKIECPYVMLGSYDYTHTSFDGTVTCTSTGDSLSTCIESTEITFDYNTCSTKVAYSVSESVWCVDTVPSGGNNYITVYNGNDADSDIDNTNVYRFACIAVSEDGTLASIAPNSCRKDQTPDAFPTHDGNDIGATLTMSKSAESCLTCPFLTAPDSGTVSYSTNGAITTANYACSSEYSLAGPESRVCQTDNSWADEEPTCTCIVPATPANGSFAVSVDGTLTYSCDVGFVLNGDRTRTCQTNANTWSGVEPTCDPCDDIVVSTGLSITASATGTTTISSFTCAAGYTLDGSTNSTCLLSGTWDTNAPSCLSCENIISSDTLQVTITTDGYTSTANFTCVTGYHVVGESSATCDDAGAWGSTPTCECDEQVASSNGTRIGNGTSSQFSCDVGYNLIGSSVTACLDDGTGWSADPPICDGCESLVNPGGGYYNLSTDGVVTMATYSCNPGYTMSGQQFSYCQNDGTWNRTAPTCIECPDLTNPASGTVTINTDGVTSEAMYVCASGYNISGETTSTCLTDGSWTNTPPTCSCSHASEPADGTILSDNGESVYYQCNVNYSMNGTSVRECTTDGTGWSGSDPTCVPCETLVTVAGGSFSSTTDGVNTKVEYSCDIGYTINGKKEIKCNSDGTWDSSQSTCTQCEALTIPSGGNFTMYRDDLTVTKATFTCDVGYTLDGYSELTCEETGLWDNDIPQCVECSARSNPSSGNLTLETDGQATTGVYYCANGYTLVGQQTISCRIDGNWNYPSSECECETPGAPINGTVSADGETVTFSCDTGFTMSGDSTGTCNTDGTGWSIATPQCVQCENLDSFTSGNVTYVSDGSTTAIQYSCPKGSSLQGSPVDSCNASGNWESELPECVSCPTLPSVSVTTGSVTLVTNGTTTTAEYSCPLGYVVKGSQTLTCNSNGTWSNDPSDCVCETPTIPDGGNFTLSEDGLSVNFSCGAGYTMVGEQTISCGTDGSGWVLEYPNCTKCEELTPPSNGSITLVTSGTQTTALYGCGVGYTLDGSAEPTCQSDGTWTAVEQTCVSCPDLPDVAVTGGSVSLLSNGTTTVAVYSCPAGYEVSGSENLTCNSSGVWDSTPSTCVCETPDIPDGGNYTLSDDGLSITFECGAGYTMNGVQEIACAIDGSGWTVVFPNCTQCESRTTPGGGNISLVTNGTQTIAVYSCGVGSSLDGEPTPECQEDGTWTSTETICVTCPNLPDVSISTGNVTLETDGTTTTALYHCPQGYEVNGSQNITCNTNGTWSPSPSDCVCKTPNYTEGTNFTLSENGLNVTFTCDSGYTMVGEQTISCGTDGSGWNDSQPNCTKCEDLTAPSGGDLTLITSGTQTTAVYTCAVGSTLDGQPTPECGTDGTWSAVGPVCVSCPDLPDITVTGGSVSLESNGTTTIAVYSCPPGYKISGSDNLTCNSSGVWDSTPSTCVCETPDIPDGGNYTLSEDGLGITFECGAGYTMNGVQEIACAIDGSGWTLAFPNCTQCESITDPSGGIVSLVTNGTQTIAVYSCGVGSSLDGESTPECQEDGTWNSTEPICVTCPNLPDVSISTGNVTLETNGKTTTAIYNCPEGYDVNGSQNITCNTNGTWSSSPSDCVCKTPNFTEGSNFTLSENGLTVTFTCESGYTMVGEQTISCGTDGSGWNVSQPNCTKCEDLTAPSGGDLALITSGAQTTAVYTCAVGSTLDGQPTPECGTDGTWSAEGPVCVSCPDAVNITSAILNVTTDGQKTKAVYTCDSGYEMEGNAIISCLTNGTWDNEPPICFCEAPSSPLFGNALSNRTIATYSCVEGYILEGEAVRKCQDNGLGWTGTAPTCTTCDALSIPADGSYNLTTNGIVTIATFSCDVGYSMNGTQTLVCLDDGSWSEQVPSCVQCPDLVQPNSGSLVIFSDNIKTSANYTCSMGYYIVGESNLVCSSEGQWSASEPFCACNNLTAPDNGNVTISVNSGIATYMCELGYSIDGVSTRTCSNDSSGWSDTDPSCVGCPNVTITADGSYDVVSDGIITLVNFQCDTGASIDGPASLTCQSDGTWTSVQPSCVSCPDLESPSSGNITIDTDGQISTVTYTCADNYEVVGDATQQCQTDGTWSGSKTTCVCVAPEVPANGTVTLQSNNLVAVYTCDLSFSLTGDSERTCQTDGSGWTGSNPTCVQCETLLSPSNGSILTDTNGTHTISTFACSLQTSMLGEATSVCTQDATWSSTEPTCVTCPSLSDPNSGNVTLSTDGMSTIGQYACASGYEVSGQPVSTCLVDGSWSNTAPECLCRDPSSIGNGTVSSNGREANFQCNVGYSLLGTSGIICNADGTGWSDQVPECIKCNNLNTSSGGTVEYTSTGIATLASFKCDVGTSLSGSTILTCYVNGSWNGTSPSCVACEDLTSLSNGEYIMSTDGTTTTLELQCNDGYEASGTTDIECGTDGQWKYSKQSTCDKIDEEADSLLGALLGVSIASLVIIIVLSILLARFVYLYLQSKRGGEKYTTDVSRFDSGEKFRLPDDEFPLNPVKLTRSAAPLNHQHSAFDITGPFSTSPAPQGFEDHLTGNGAVPPSPLPIETHRSGNSIISFRRSATTLTNKSVSSVSAITIATAKETPTPLTNKTNKLSPIKNGAAHSQQQDFKPSRLSPIPKHMQRIANLGQASPKINKIIKESQLDNDGKQTPVEGRPPSVMSHSVIVSNFDSKSLDSVSIVGD